MSEIITIEEATKILGFKTESETRHWLKWQSVPVTDIANNSFLKRKDLEAALNRIMENGTSIQTYVPQGEAEKVFYDKLLQSLADNKKPR